jgi:hypothetical protein
MLVARIWDTISFFPNNPLMFWCRILKPRVYDNLSKSGNRYSSGWISLPPLVKHVRQISLHKHLKWKTLLQVVHETLSAFLRKHFLQSPHLIRGPGHNSTSPARISRICKSDFGGSLEQFPRHIFHTDVVKNRSFPSKYWLIYCSASLYKHWELALYRVSQKTRKLLKSPITI